MRSRPWLVIALAIAMFAFTPPQTAEAFGWERRHDHATVYHRVYRPHYRHVYVYHDPYAYRPARVGYYPYYNSRLWVPRNVYRARKVHYRHRLPDYYSSWGYPVRRHTYRKSYRKHAPKRQAHAMRRYHASRPRK